MKDFIIKYYDRMRDFAAIDFETANNERSSVCCLFSLSLHAMGNL